MTQLEGLANRGYRRFLRRHVHAEYQNETGSSRFDHQQFVGEVLERNEDYIKIDVKSLCSRRLAGADDIRQYHLYA
jgi:putative protease